jgi:Transposase IS4
VFSSAVIKKRRYWPKHVPGDAMDAFMNANHGIGECNALTGSLNDTNYSLFVMKDVEYNMKLMATYGRLIPKDNAAEKQRRVQGQIVKLKYMEPFANHYLYRHCVDDHNNLRHSDISLEEIWVTHSWENRVFAFILAISEVNTFLGWKLFANSETTMTMLQFRRCLAKELITNDYDNEEESSDLSPRRSKRKRLLQVHQLEHAPPHAQRFSCGKWIRTSKQKYQQYTCKTPGCTKKIRTFCSCEPGFWMCMTCHDNHVIEMAMQD